MEAYSLGTIEARFADIIWEKEPIAMAELVKLCEVEFGWKRTTTYTVLKRLSQKGIFQNEGGVVTALISKEEYYSCQSEQFVETSFGGSLPNFLAAFTRKKKLSKSEIDELKKIIEDCEG